MKRIALIMLLIGSNGVFAQHHFLVESDKPLICGHRGGFYNELPENSMAAFKSTTSSSQSPRVIVEFDIRKSKDGTLFIMHDETVDRTTNGRGKIADLSDAYLGTLLLKNEQGEITQEKIPTCEDVLIYAEKKATMLLMLDIKADVWEEAIQRLKAKGLSSRSIILTFTPEDAKKVYGLSHDVAISCLLTDDTKWSAIEALEIPNRNLVAYISPSTPAPLLIRLRNSRIPLMTDTSEHTTHQGELYPAMFYKELVSGKQLTILITDFPIEVSKISLK